MKRSTKHLAVLCALCGALGAAIGAAVYEHRDAEVERSRVSKAQADARTAFGRLHDQQERQQDEIEAARSAGFQEAWDACKKDQKP